MKKKLLSALTLGIFAFASAYAENSYGIPEDIQESNILHCFDWTFSDIQNELPNIANAGFGAIQVSPVQGNAASNAEWFYAYMPYDFIFKANGNGTRAQLQSLCSKAAEYGIKIIVDVVANHVNQASGYHDTWWDSNGRVRWNGGVDYNNRYSITHGQLGGYGDVNSEDAAVQQRAKSFVEDLKSIGVKGIRWDAAKHIGLPSEGCNFWSVVTSVPGMYHYGEILDGPGGDANKLMAEYTKYMSVTDNSYSDQCRNNDGVPGSHAGWASNTIAANKVVYWGESHDDYSNEWQATTNVSQQKIDRAYAIEACRNGATALYFSRPSGKDRNAIRMGQKGSTNFTNAQIAEVNKFRNVMNGRPDYYTNGGSAASVTRQGGGAVIVKKGGGGSVSVGNGGGYCPVGEYKDRVSGNTFTVTATTINGTVGPSGIAVIYGTEFGDYTPDTGNQGGNGGNNGGDTGDGFVIYFDNTASNWTTPYIHYWGASESSWPGVAMTKVTGNVWSYTVPAGTTGCIFNAGDGDATKTQDFVAQANHIYTTSGDQGEYDNGGNQGGNQGGDDSGNTGNGFVIYFDNSESNWSTPYIHYWGTSGSSWPGVAMTKVTGNVWSYTVPEGTTGCLFNAGDGDATKTSDFVAQANHIYTKSGDQGEYNNGGNSGGNTGSDTDFVIYFDNTSSNWATPYIHYWGASESSWPGVAMTKVVDNIWSYTVPAGTTGCLFNAGDGDATKTQDFVAKPNHIYNTSGDQGVYKNSSVEGIEKETTLNVSIVKGGIQFNDANGEYIMVVSMNGRMVVNQNVNGSLYITLTPGVYVVNVEGKSNKVFVK
ncbi:MAG: starch-binding protein [Muribaculaceae bacterium]|nr:starch-binding protein [Muribaculaceae bacterium]